VDGRFLISGLSGPGFARSKFSRQIFLIFPCNLNASALAFLEKSPKHIPCRTELAEWGKLPELLKNLDQLEC